MSPWLRKPKYAALQRREMPGGLWAKCPRCKNLIYQKELERNLQVCPKCGYHHRLSATDRIAVTLDPGSFVEFDAGLTSVDPLGFTDYPEKREEARRRTGRAEAAFTGMGALEGFRTIVAALDFFFMGGSMGSVVGGKVARAGARALGQRLPLVLFFASRGPAPRADPGALRGFAGRRVIEQTIGRRLPEDFQTAEFCREHGLIDMIVPRDQLRPQLSRLLRFFGAPRGGPGEPALGEG